jgi:hypothetical protein
MWSAARHRCTSCAAAVLLGLLLSHAARADHFAIDLTVTADKHAKTAHAETAGLGVTAKPRAILELPAGKPIVATWSFTCTDKKESFKDVVIHFFVVKEEKAGQAAVPKLDQGVVAENAMTMDFKPKDKARGGLNFQIDKPGTYLLRVETLGASVGTEGHEHFAALDLVVK